MRPSLKRLGALLGCALTGAGAGGCANTVSTSSFRGEDRAVAQAVADLQSDVTATDERKVCANDLAHALVVRLAALPGGCRRTIKDQLAMVDNYDMSVQAVTVNATGTAPTASARVRSILGGKNHISTLSLIKEGGRWKVSGSS